MAPLCRFLVFLAALVVLPLSGCSADHAAAPDPGVRTPGAFFVVPARQGGYLLWRTLGEYVLNEAESILFVITYDVNPKSVGEARRLAQDESLPIDISTTLVTWADVQTGQVVWFRSLTDEEVAEIR